MFEIWLGCTFKYTGDLGYIYSCWYLLCINQQPIHFTSKLYHAAVYPLDDVITQTLITILQTYQYCAIYYYQSSISSYVDQLFKVVKKMNNPFLRSKYKKKQTLHYLLLKLYSMHWLKLVNKRHLHEFVHVARKDAIFKHLNSVAKWTLKQQLDHLKQKDLTCSITYHIKLQITLLKAIKMNLIKLFNL